MQLKKQTVSCLLAIAVAAHATVFAQSAMAQSQLRRTRTQSGAMVREQMEAESDRYTDDQAASLPRSMRARPATIEIEGTLKRNTGARRDESPYWLMEKGVARYAISPRPGVDLDEYEGRRIVVQGQKQKMPGEMTPRLVVSAAESKAERVARQRDTQAEPVESEFDLVSAEEEIAPTLVGRGPVMARPTGSAVRRRGVAPVAMEEEEFIEEQPVARTARASRRVSRGSSAAMHGGEVIYDDGGPAYYGEGPYLDGAGCCDSCGGNGCDFCNGCLPGDYGYGLQGGLYFRAEYLHWWTKGMNTPALVSTSTDTVLNNTNLARTGAIDAANTTILYGNDRIFNTSRSGGRITIGMWIDPCHQTAVEGEYFSLGQARETYANQANGLAGSQVIMRPFTQVGGLAFDGNGNVIQGQQAITGNSAQIVSFPAIARGSINVEATNRFQGAGAWVNRLMACGADCDRQYQFGFNYGWRYLRLDDDLNITENVTNLRNNANNTGTDSFQTKNVFNGFAFGPNFHTRWNCWSAQGSMKVSLGGTRSNARIRGTLNSDGTVFNDRGILLVQTSNFGDYQRSDFAVVPEMNLMLGYQFNPVWRVTLGASLIYWPKVYRAGDIINTDVNTDHLAGLAPVSGLNRPTFRWISDDFWAYGVSVGAEARY